MDDTVRVLHVDDEPDVGDLVATFLEREDDAFAVETAEHPDAGMARLAKGGVDCVVSDFDMAGTDGIAFLERVRESYPDLPFILYTGKGSEAVASDAISAGVTDYLQKETGTSQYTVLANRIRNAVEQYRARRAAEETEEKLSQLAENTDAILYMVDGDWTELLFVNSAYEEVWGMSLEALREDPESFLERVHPDDRDVARASMERLAAGDPDSVEYRLRRGDGEVRWVRGESRPVLDDDGDVERIVGSVRDVTDEKEQYRRLETLISNLPGIAYRCLDERGWPMEFVRGECERLTGHTSSALETEVSWGEDVVHPEDREAVRESIETAVDAGRPFEVTYRIVTADDETRWVWERGRAVEDRATGETVLEGLITDVTERHVHEETLEALTAQLEALSRASRDLLSADSAEAVAEVAVGVADGVLGLEASAVHLHDPTRDVLAPVAWTDLVEDLVGEPPTFEPGSSIAWRTFEAGDVVAIDDVRGDEDTHNPETPIHSELQAPIGDRGIFLAGSPTPAAFDDHDVLLAELLAGTVATALDTVERTRELRDREAELERQNERLAAFASLVSHDLRNPLGVAQGRLELAREECDSEHLDAVEGAHDRMAALVDDVLTLAREGEGATNLETVDPASLARACWSNVDTGDATLEVGDVPALRADESRLQHVFENLVRNALEHGGPAVTVTVGPLDDAAGFYVADDGPGIAPEDRERVFEAGYSTLQGGTGLGLSIVRQVAEAHGWTVAATEGAKGGARFEFTGVDFVEE